MDVTHRVTEMIHIDDLPDKATLAVRRAPSENNVSWHSGLTSEGVKCPAASAAAVSAKISRPWKVAEGATPGRDVTQYGKRLSHQDVGRQETAPRCLAQRIAAATTTTAIARFQPRGRRQSSGRFPWESEAMLPPRRRVQHVVAAGQPISPSATRGRWRA